MPVTIEVTGFDRPHRIDSRSVMAGATAEGTCSATHPTRHPVLLGPDSDAHRDGPARRTPGRCHRTTPRASHLDQPQTPPRRHPRKGTGPATAAAIVHHARLEGTRDRAGAAPGRRSHWRPRRPSSSLGTNSSFATGRSRPRSRRTPRPGDLEPAACEEWLYAPGRTSSAW